MMIYPQITFGNEIQKRNVAGFILTETRHEPNVYIPAHDHENANFNFVIDGFLNEILGAAFSRSHECQPGIALYKPPAETHKNRCGTAGAHCLILELTSEIDEQMFAFFRNSTPFESRQTSPFFLKIYKEMQSTDSAAPFIIEGLILQILGESIRTPAERSPGGPKWLEQFLGRLHEHFDQPLILMEIARELNIHPVHLQKTFRKYKGCSPGHYLRKLRIQFAAHRLMASDESVGSIAQAAGFYDQSHFCRSFKQFFGVTPQDFRRHNR